MLRIKTRCTCVSITNGCSSWNNGIFKYLCICMRWKECLLVYGFISICKTSFQVGMDLKKYRNKAEMKEHKKTTLLWDDGGEERQKTTLHFFHFCLVFTPFSGPSLLEMSSCRYFSLVSVLFGGVSKPTSK